MCEQSDRAPSKERLIYRSASAGSDGSEWVTASIAQCLGAAERIPDDFDVSRRILPQAIKRRRTRNRLPSPVAELALQHPERMLDPGPQAGNDQVDALVDRRKLATQGSPRLSRHEVDDLYDAALAEGLRAGTIVISGQIAEQNVPAKRIAGLVRDLHRSGVSVIADVSGSTLEAIEGGVSILKVSHEELIGMDLARGADECEIVSAIKGLADGAAKDIVVSMADRGALALFGGRLLRVEQPALEAVDKTGAGDSMTAGLAVARASGMDAEATLRLAAAAGALNVTRRGRGTGALCDVTEIAKLIAVWSGPLGPDGWSGMN